MKIYVVPYTRRKQQCWAVVTTKVLKVHQSKNDAILQAFLKVLKHVDSELFICRDTGMIENYYKHDDFFAAPRKTV